MSDTYRRYGAIKRAIMPFYRPRPSGQREKHLNTLVALICGLAGGRHAQLSAIADHAPSEGAKHGRVIDRFRRWLKHDRHIPDGWSLPVAKELLQTLATQPIHLVMDGSLIGRGCIASMLSVVYHGRALPLCWVVVRGTKGHFPEAMRQELLSQVQEIMAEGASVTIFSNLKVAVFRSTKAISASLHGFVSC